MYKYTGVAINSSEKESITGEIQNFGTYEINVPQVLYSYYDNESNIYWCDVMYLQKGIRSQRRKPFTIVHPKLNTITTILEGKKENTYVNGSQNALMTLENKADHNKRWQEIISDKNTSIRIQSNGFVYQLNK